MKTKLLVGAVILSLILGGWQAASAESRPAIVSFASSLVSITVDEAESGTATTTLTWDTIGLSDDYRLTLNMYILDGWKPVFPADSVPLEANGERVVTIQPSLTFGPPTYLLSIVGAKTNAIIDQRIVTIPYTLADATASPTIDIFMTNVESLDGTQLAAGSLPVTVSWSVSNRVPTANLIFEQLFKDGSGVPVELPRPYLWVPSTAEGPVAPVYPVGEEQVTLRLRVVDVVSGDLYDEQTLELPLVNIPAVPPVAATPVPTATPVPPPTVPSEIASFSANPTTVNPGSAVTLAWEVRGTGGVTIEQTIPGIPGSQVVVTAQSPKGSAEVYLPDSAAYTVTFTLYPISRASNAQVTVLVYCPVTFFFGQGDGCPTSAAADVGASYQEFENGFMIWRQDTNEIYVFYSDGTASYFLQQDYAQLPDPVIKEAPPLDRQIPGGGFGKVWFNAPNVELKLGWALSDEQGFTTRVQGVAQAREPRPEFAFYLTLPGSEVIGSGYGLWRKLSG
jgi:hypothetical protein